MKRIKKEGLVMDTQSQYMLLSRLQSDCYGFLDYGSKLWGIDPKTHADKMIELWNGLKIKPKWLPLSELKDLTYRIQAR